MQRLQALCEAFVASRITVASVCNVLAHSLDMNRQYLQQECYKLLARDNPTTNPAFAMQLVGALSNYPSATAIAIVTTSARRYQPEQMLAATLVPDPTLQRDLAALLSNSSELWQASQSEDTDLCNLNPDCILEVNEVSFGAHRFVLAARSDYFRAVFSTTGGGGFAEGATAKVTLQLPEPLPSAPAIRALLNFIYSGDICQGSTSLGPEDILDLLALAGPDDSEGDGTGGYFGLHDSTSLKEQALTMLVKAMESSPSPLTFLRRASALGQNAAIEAVFASLLLAPKVTLDALVAAALESMQYEEWWSESQEVYLKSCLFAKSLTAFVSQRGSLLS